MTVMIQNGPTHYRISYQTEHWTKTQPWKVGKQTVESTDYDYIRGKAREFQAAGYWAVHIKAKSWYQASFSTVRTLR
jgi:hypothetical protein